MTETRWLDDDEQRTWRTFLMAVHLLDGALDRQLRHDSGMPHAYYQILVMLSEAPNRELTMTRLARLLRSSPSRLSHAAARLESEGRIRRFKRPGDRRTTLVELTDAGMDVLREAAFGHVNEVRRLVFDPLTPEQVEQLRVISEAMLGALDPQGEEPRYADPEGLSASG
ncbi:MarR family winged helix-turn-helix transcriptional regulator [Nocardiopsis sp. MG754419]|uniref:MarR family winged helix-turn-helix transcriptional regulator n=1 Tax=Nocardiopsis sp. MG754419 TaxID=2259865 RepID=UPI001BA738A6|nr:MarR family transcriptional regulator [Nocardiopsis sp. MG754419]MBR8743128.1 MarR family transcriptional regulator [Nocardiopsis sp. MG754419]